VTIGRSASFVAVDVTVVFDFLVRSAFCGTGDAHTRLRFCADACCGGPRDFLVRTIDCSDALLLLGETNESTHDVGHLSELSVATGESWVDFFIQAGQTGGSHVHSVRNNTLCRRSIDKKTLDVVFLNEERIKSGRIRANSD
jgi:hypothetical protein